MGTTRANGTQKPDFDKLLSFDAGDTQHPPWFVNSLAWIGIGIGIAANVMQVITTDIAFQTLIRQNGTYQSMGPHGQAAAEAPIQLICAGIAVIMQLALLFFLFRVTQEFKHVKSSTGASGVEAMKDTAVSVISHQQILVVFAVLSLVADTVGDFTFISLYVQDFFVIFFYGASLYAAGTAILSKALETQWAAAVAYANWKAFKLYNKLQELKLAGVKAGN